MASKYQNLRTDIKIRKYPNRALHPEFQRTDVSAGWHSVLLKQLEINEELLRALIDIQISGMSKQKQSDMLDKYKGLI
jgi:hypothetical protein